MPAVRKKPLKTGDFITEQTAKPSQAMRAVLMNLALGRDPWVHLSGRSMHGGSGATQMAMVARGWLTREKTELTEVGAAVAAKVVGLGDLTEITLDRLIQAHPSLHMVDLLRAERCRRLAGCSES